MLLISQLIRLVYHWTRFLRGKGDGISLPVMCDIVNSENKDIIEQGNVAGHGAGE